MQMPPPIGMTELGSFAHCTLTQRLPNLCHRLIEENDFSPAIANRLIQLAAEIPEGQIQRIELNAPDAAEWQTYLHPYLEQRWIDLPWYFAEAYFYRRVLGAIDYFRTHLDPYAFQKQLGIEQSWVAMQALSQQLNDLPLQWRREDLTDLVYFALWGNRMDLSLRPANAGSHYGLETHHEAANLLVDDTPQVMDWLLQQPTQRIDLILDNAGFELFCDLCLTDYLLTRGMVESIRLHVKAQPIFVSDTLRQDIGQMIEQLQKKPHPAVHALVDRLHHHQATDRLQIQEHPFWTAPFVFEEMPVDLRQELAEARLVIVKGDANYRRLLGDRQWDLTTPFAAIAAYFPAPVVALRTCKSELACGLASAQVQKLNQSDPDWLTNGQRGMIQFANRESAG